MDFIDLKSQQALIREELEQRIKAVLDHGRYILGPEVFELEEKLADYVGVKHCVTVSSGTDAILISLMALDIGPGDQVITVPYTWISTAEVIVRVGASPVFIDIEHDTWNMDPALLDGAITEKTKAIIPVGIFGQTANLTEINRIAKEHGNIPVIEDAAQCFGATHHGKKSCSLSIIGCTSFFPSKPLGAYGDGGAIFTNDDDLAEKFRAIRVHGQTAPNHFPYLGTTGRLDTLQATILLAKLTLLDQEILQRNNVASHYRKALLPSNQNLQMPTVTEENASVWAQYTILVQDRDSIQEKLKRKSVPSVAYYAKSLHLQPVFNNSPSRTKRFPVTEKVANRCISFPMNPYLTQKTVHRICDIIR